MTADPPRNPGNTTRGIPPHLIRFADRPGSTRLSFRRGVTYRGTLTAGASGTAADPIRLTSDPKWGSGEAIISGAERITAAWEPVTDTARHGLPPAASGRVWKTALPKGSQPMLLWITGTDGSPRRLPIAREPNWGVSDPYRIGSEWWRWEGTAIDYPALTGTDTAHLKGADPGAFVGATVWTDPPIAEFSWNPPEPSVVKAYDPAAGKLTFTVNHGSKYPKTGSRYFLENLPRFLDTAGEWLYRADGPTAGTLYLWAPDGNNPGGATVEVARRPVVLDIAGQSHIAVRGLTLRGGNAPDPSQFNSRREGFNTDKPWLTDDLGAIRLRGNVSGITVANCRIADTAVGITYAPAGTATCWTASGSRTPPSTTSTRPRSRWLPGRSGETPRWAASAASACSETASARSGSG
jgi:hypothetical protein